MDRRASLVSRVTDTPSDIVVMKFGGSSVGSADRIEQVVDIVIDKKKTADPIVVVSAVGGVTDYLAEALEEMAVSSYDPVPLIEKLRELHVEVGSRVLAETHAADYRVSLEDELGRLRQDIVRTRGNTITPTVRDRILSIGERLSAPLLARALSTAGCPAAAFNATTLISTIRSNGDVSVDFKRTQSALRRWHALRNDEIVPVITGYIGGTPDGKTTTLGRGGSDYSAAVVTRALQAPVLERWTDVDGLYTEDPHENGKAEHLRTLTYEEALERTHRGEFGMHPRTLDPLTDTDCEVHVRGTLTPNAPGTVISSGE